MGIFRENKSDPHMQAVGVRELFQDSSCTVATGAESAKSEEIPKGEIDGSEETDKAQENKQYAPLRVQKCQKWLFKYCG